MQCAIIPPELLSTFDVALSPCIRVSPVLIHTGTYAGSYAVNAAIVESCPEWRAAREAALALVAAHGVAKVELDPAVLVKTVRSVDEGGKE